MSTATAVEPDKAIPTDFRGHILHKLAEREMSDEMVRFPWKALDVIEDAVQKDAEAAGFITQRQADAQQVEHTKALVDIILSRGMREGGQKVLLTLTSDSEPKPRSRGMVLTLQAVIQSGLPAFIVDRVEPPNKEHDCVRHKAELLIVYPQQ